MSYKILLACSLVLLVIGLSIAVVDAQRPPPGGRRSPAVQPLGTGFTYQGQLKNNGALVNGSCDLAFRLYDDASSGSQVGSAITQTIVITNGLFTTQLNAGNEFGANAFNGDARWLDILVRCPPASSFTTLTPREPVTPAPMAFALPGLYIQQNATSPNVIGGNSGNSVSPGKYGATIGGGGGITDAFGIACPSCYNSISTNYGTIGGGLSNTIPVIGYYATIGGGLGNSASGSRATVGGGANNTAIGSYTTVGGGWDNHASNDYATVGGGVQNTANNQFATVGGGNINTASNQYATVGGGNINNASGSNATVPGGYLNTAQGDYSFAAGKQAKALNDGAFVWNDSTSPDFNSTANNQFLIRAAGGMGVGTNSPAAQFHVSSSGGDGMPQLRVSQTSANEFARVRLTNDSVSPSNGYLNRWDIAAISTTFTIYTGKYDQNALQLTPVVGLGYMTMGNGAYLTHGGTWTNFSNKNLKANFANVDSRDILAHVNALPIQIWNYKAESTNVRHIGPTAQDFYAAFGLGQDDEHITTVDADGVALAAIQGLFQMVQEKDAEIEKLKAQSEKQQAKIETLEARIAALEHASSILPTPLSKGGKGGIVDWNATIALFIGALGVVAYERARKGGAG